MKKIYLPLFLLLPLILLKCQSDNRRAQQIQNDKELKITTNNQNSTESFPKLVSIEKLSGTEMVATLNDDLAQNKNTIYGVSLLLGWDYLHSVLQGNFLIPDNEKELKLINNTTYYKDALNKDECEIKTKIGDGISISTSFHKQLPFAHDFIRLNEALHFQGKKVASFNIPYPLERIAKQVHLLYYKDDNHFIIKIDPNDSAHEIILAKGLAPASHFADLVKEIKALKLKGKNEIKIPGITWKYEFRREDILSVPILHFNIRKEYREVENSTFTCQGTKHFIMEMRQSIAFVLDESGARIRDSSNSLYDSIGKEPIFKPTPKKLIFDRPFVLMLKKTGIDNPYFMVKVENTELMEETK